MEAEVRQGRMQAFYERLKYLFLKYERRVASISLLTGFVIDNVLFIYVEVETVSLVLLGHLALAAAAIVIINLQDRSGWPGWLYRTLHPIAPALMQFSFGALLGAFTVFYTHSGAIIVSWPFLLLLVALLIGNEFFRRRYQLMAFHASVWFIALILYGIFVAPILMGSVGAPAFLAGSVAALAVMGMFLWGLARLSPARFAQSRRAFALAIGGIFLGLQVLYFANIIPPIPLTLREAGAYHSVERLDSGNYVVIDEQRAWSERFPWPGRLLNQTIHIVPGEPVYVFSAVFAPTRLTTPIVHRWQRYDAAASAWVTTNTVSFPISGGRQGGYRGYTLKTNIEPGQWRVNVETNRGQLLGRVSFTVERVAEPVPREADVR